MWLTDCSSDIAGLHQFLWVGLNAPTNSGARDLVSQIGN
jgi:hypothetical protein